MSDLLNAEQIFGCDDSRIERVDVPEWGGYVYVRNLTGEERDAFEASCLKKTVKGRYEQTHENIRAKLVVRAVCDAEGNRLFKDADAARLGKKSGAAMDRLYDVASRLSGIREEDIEELAGNSESDPNIASG